MFLAEILYPARIKTSGTVGFSEHLVLQKLQDKTVMTGIPIVIQFLDFSYNLLGKRNRLFVNQWPILITFP
jgi:hypothetical protein